MRYIKPTLLFALIFALLCFAACGQPTQAVQNTPAVSAAPAATPVSTPATAYTVSYNNPHFIGSTHAVLSAQLSLANGTPSAHGFILPQHNIKLNAAVVDGTSYAALNGLEPETAYTYKIWYVVDGEEKLTEQSFKITTPARQMSEEVLNNYLAEELAEQNVTEENRILLQSQACLNLLGLETDRYGKWGAVTQANLTRVVYTANALDGFVDYTHVSALADEYTLNLLKDILSVDILTNGEALIKPFEPAPHSLTGYALRTDEGGSLNVEAYIAKLRAENADVQAIYDAYPYSMGDAVFKQKYADTIASDDFNEQGLAAKLAGYAAKNKAMFSYKAKDWMEEIATPKERLVTFAGSENEITVNAYVAYAYMLIDAYRATGDVLATSTTYRDVDKQWYFYSKKQDRSVAYRLNGSWHLDRQVYSYVPGFSNHQYGVAIDFYERNTFGDTDLYTYLNQHAADYGYYNYYIEPWHWVYLGKTF